MTLLDELLQKKKERESVYCPEWDKTFFVKRMNSGEKSSWNSAVIKVPDGDAERLLLCFTVVDAENNLVFPVDRLEEMKDLDGAEVSRLATVAVKLNKLGVESDVKKNSEATTT